MFSFPSAIPPPIPFPLDIGLSVLSSLLVLFVFAAGAILVDTTSSWRKRRTPAPEGQRATSIAAPDRSPPAEETSIAA